MGKDEDAQNKKVGNLTEAQRKMLGRIQIGVESPPPSPFEVRGELSVRDSATVICVRRRQQTDNQGKSESTSSSAFPARLKKKYGSLVAASPFVKDYLSSKSCPPDFEFTSGWEVLLGQSEVINWLKSTREKRSVMRYAGEYKLAGGNVDSGETIEEAAKRELREEFLRPAETQVPEDAIVLRPFSVKQTRPIRSRSNLMYNFIALADGEENAWLQYLDVDAINEALQTRRETFLSELKKPDSPYFDLPKSEKEKISPEVFQLSWLPLDKAMEYCLGSVLPGVFVNQWQEEQFGKLRRSRRDPLIMTGATLVELEKFPTVTSLRQHCESVEMETLRENEQWLFPGMDDAAVKQAFDLRLGKQNVTNPSFPLLRQIERERSGSSCTSGPKL